MGSRVGGLLPGMKGQVQTPAMHDDPAMPPFAVSPQSMPLKFAPGLVSVQVPLAPQFALLVCPSVQIWLHMASGWAGLAEFFGHVQAPLRQLDPASVPGQFVAPAHVWLPGVAPQ